MWERENGLGVVGGRLGGADFLREEAWSSQVGY